MDAPASEREFNIDDSDGLVKLGECGPFAHGCCRHEQSGCGMESFTSGDTAESLDYDDEKDV